MRNENVARKNAAYLMSAAQWITAVAAVGGAATMLLVGIEARELVVPVFSASSLLLAIGVFTMYAGSLETQAAKGTDTVGEGLEPEQLSSSLGSPIQHRKQTGRGRTWDFPALLRFDGRIPRRVFWAISLTSAFASTILGIVGTPGIVLDAILAVPFVWVGLAVQVKRWHDRGKSGWMVLVNCIPLIGFIWAFIETGCLRGTVGENLYGPDPT
jgi:uncharacterized membrane protein YhaH (DUF805 family)